MKLQLGETASQVLDQEVNFHLKVLFSLGMHNYYFLTVCKV